MKMTKTIREFINEEVEKRILAKYADELEFLRNKRDTEMENWSKAYNQFKAEMENGFKNLLETYGYSAPENNYYNKPTITTSGFNHAYLPAERTANELKKIINEEIAAATKDIIVTMELGGSKQELMEMLNKLGA